jgi:coproporphyrinogen III oxidase-like Fe-S oxidoreductase
VHLKDRTISQTALPIQAFVLEEFTDRNELSVSYLSEKLGLDAEKIKEICKFWERKGILSNNEDTWRVLETRQEGVHGNIQVLISRRGRSFFRSDRS